MGRFPVLGLGFSQQLPAGRNDLGCPGDYIGHLKAHAGPGALPLTDDDRDIIDSSKDGGPLAYLHGEGQIVKGLEKAMEGRKAGDSFSVTVAPEEGYGLPDPEKIAVVTADQIEGGEDLEEGMQLEASNEAGEQIVVVSKIEGNKVTLDGNHPWPA